jgi:thioredoxin-related protein
MTYINARQMSSRADMRFGLRALCALFTLLILASVADAAELVMFRRDGCSWCARWDREIGPIYPKSDIGRRVPLRKIDLDRNSAASILLHGRIHYTPTFVLAENGAELGRIEGYPGEAFFWGLLQQLVERLPAAKGVSAPGPVLAGNKERAP